MTETRSLFSFNYWVEVSKWLGSAATTMKILVSPWCCETIIFPPFKILLLRYNRFENLLLYTIYQTEPINNNIYFKIQTSLKYTLYTWIKNNILNLRRPCHFCYFYVWMCNVVLWIDLQTALYVTRTVFAAIVICMNESLDWGKKEYSNSWETNAGIL